MLGRSGSKDADGRPRWSIVRWAAAATFAGLLVAAGSVDPVAAAIAVALLGGIAVLLHHRDRRAERVAVIAVGLVLVTAATLVALTLPAYSAGRVPLAEVPSALGTAANPGRKVEHRMVESHRRERRRRTVKVHGKKVVQTKIASVPVFTNKVSLGATPGVREVLGFAEMDQNDTASGIDHDLPGLSTLAATGIQLADVPGTLDITPPQDAVARTHRAGAGALTVIQNYNETIADFDGARAQRTLGDPLAQRQLVSGLVAEVDANGWDGVVLDLENLVAESRDAYPQLVTDLKAALGSRRVLVAVPAFSNATDADDTAFDLAALGRAADGIVWMAYDQHADTDPAGPIAALAWVQATLDVLLPSVPPGKVLLGVAGYGYAWPANGAADEVSVPQAQELASKPGARVAFDEVIGEWAGTTADGRRIWYDDAHSSQLHAALAARNGLAGVALWRVGSDDSGLVSSLPFPPVKQPAQTDGRPVDDVPARGLVALTFDDGPDPTWTPKILDVLEREHVPGTFFLVGKQAQSHQGIVRRELAAGNVVADHTFSHPNMAAVPTWEQRLQIEAGAWTIEGITGRKPLLFRSPYGAGDRQSGGHRIGADQLAIKMGMHPEGWTDDPQDWTSPGADTIVQRVLSGSGVRTVVLLHDGGGDRSQTLAALPKLIESLRAQGFAFTTVDRLDATLSAPYLQRRGFLSVTQGLMVIAGFRAEQAIRRLVLWLLLASAVLAPLRLVVCGPLAGVQRWRTRKMLTWPTDRPWPSVTIIVPAYNEVTVIAKALAGLARLDPKPDQVIVVDDGSTDGTAALAGSFELAGLEVVSQANCGKAAALNTGLGLARGEICVVIDADTVVDPGFLAAVVPHFQDPTVGAVAGNVKVGNRRRLLAALQGLEYIVSLNLDKRAQAMLGVVGIVPGAGGAFRTSALHDVSGYPTETLVEDADLTVTLLRAGWRIPYEGRAVTWTEAPQRLRDIVRQRRRWSYGTIEVTAKHRDAIFGRRSGRVGLVLLPWQLLTQVVLPLLGPLADVFLLYLLAVHDNGLIVRILALALIGDLVLAAAAVAIDGERIRMVLLAPLLRLVWRPLQLVVLARATRHWAIGRSERWRKLRRTGTVQAQSLGRSPAHIDASDL